MFGLNALFIFGGAALGRRLDPYQDANFLVEIDGLLTGGFASVEGLSGSIEVEPLAVGGDPKTQHQLLGQATWSNITLSRGVVEIDTLWNWYEATARGVIKRKSGTILMLDRKLIPVTQWTFKDAIPVAWTGPNFDGSSQQVAVESIELAHRGLSKPDWIRVASYARGIYRMTTGKESL